MQYMALIASDMLPLLSCTLKQHWLRGITGLTRSCLMAAPCLLALVCQIYPDYLPLEKWLKEAGSPGAAPKFRALRLDGHESPRESTPPSSPPLVLNSGYHSTIWTTSYDYLEVHKCPCTYRVTTALISFRVLATLLISTHEPSGRD